MTQLTNQTPESTYGDLLTTTNNGQGLPLTVPVPIQDGLGNNSPVSMSQQIVNFDTTGPLRFQINGESLTASAAQLNEVPTILPLNEIETVSTNLFTSLLILNVLPYDAHDRHSVSVSFAIEVTTVDDSLNAFGCTLSTLLINGYQSSAGINIVGSTTAVLNNIGLNTPSFRWVAGVDQIILQVQELNSLVTPTLWAVNYVMESA